MNKSKKTLLRIEKIQSELKCHEASIRRLYLYSEENIKLKDQSYLRTKEDDQRMQWTIKNLRAQMTLLSHELTVLMEYGA